MFLIARTGSESNVEEVPRVGNSIGFEKPTLSFLIDSCIMERETARM
jgi:hypothetical protein